ncbi:MULTISPECIES: hypothetical protein [Halobacterium]|uniref:Uncharacterized protein n=1 Tax=Halobacterium salinarum (strain ATCC 33171 / DSM 3754 / JCM 8978 / NBRC 102687 / NCIMB 764 / 91-R6) TaxID=2597657 RepID=A0A4D6GS96_HALS9|nr:MULTISPECIES: hypothetical protein [Halobacterium]MCF2164677.1 hypothetical protein [Halobacterium salinarum]MCF2166877.1 hypothetical protein [Halobacterium salinarum]MDL0137740.1 hypothetical protein [Halobacterium salinarum]QCC44006.1 uncharacterized protein HBSAL_01350 [Halobacterium salinarum]QRY22783.1 hypothetical protein JT689_01775 [Halobacterium sp. GSL-19]
MTSITTLRERATAAMGGSRIARTARTVASTAAAFVTESFLYGWLTAEPDPDVVVIDLRDTRTVGPFITVLTRVVGWLAPIYRESVLADGVTALGALLAWVADTQAGRALAALFEPPAPPADDAAAAQTEGEPPDRDAE